MVNPKDREPQGDPDTVVVLPHGSLVGLYIRGLKGGPAMLGIRKDADGHPVSCAVTNELYLDTSASKMRMDLLSGPRRTADDGGD